MTGNDGGRKAVWARARRRRMLWYFIAGTPAIGLLAAVLYPFFARWHQVPPPTASCISNVKNLAVAITMYVTDYDAPPDPRRWCDQTLEYVKSREAYKCPEAPGLACGYALNTGVKTATPGDTSGSGAKTVTIFESDAGWNGHGGRELLPAKPRHLGGDNYGFLEGSAKWVKRGAEEGLRWEVGGGE